MRWINSAYRRDANYLGSGQVFSSEPYQAAMELVRRRQFRAARDVLTDLERSPSLSPHQKAQLANDLAVLQAWQGDIEVAAEGFQRAGRLAPGFTLPKDNAAQLQDRLLNRRRLPTAEQPPANSAHEGLTGRATEPSTQTDDRVRVGVLSFLFNWPSTGGGIVHTVEMCKFLARAGYAVQHISCRIEPWKIGRVEAELPYEPVVLDLDPASWSMASIQRAYRRAVEAFAPDYVIITDSWNMKPRLAEALGGEFPYLLRFQSQECLCPLNNTRLLLEDNAFCQCRRNQLATPAACQSCLAARGQQSGGLHRAERQLAGVGSAHYYRCLRTALEQAEAALVLNPLIGQLLEPYCRDVRVVTWGMDTERFPWPWTPEPPRLSQRRYTIFMAGVVQEAIKGFHVLHAACERLWRRRQDFTLVATGAPAGPVGPFTQFTGWLSQTELPRYLRAADIVVTPPIAQEALARTTVEAMAVGRPVVASRIGGVPYTVQDGFTGLLFEPGNVDDLATKIERLLDDGELRASLGDAGRRRFEEAFRWEAVIEQQYRPLLARRRPVGATRQPRPAVITIDR